VTEHAIPDAASVVLRQAVRVVKSDDTGRPYEVVTATVEGATGAVDARVVTPESDPNEFARLIALEQAGAPAE